MDGPNHDQLGPSDRLHRSCADGSSVLHRTVYARSGRSELHSGNDCVPHALVSPLRQSKSYRLVLYGRSSSFRARLCARGRAAINSLVWNSRLALLFIVEGIPPIILGIVIICYLTDRPAQARWLSEAQRNWISQELEAENVAKKKIRSYTVWQALSDRRVWMLTFPYFLSLIGALANIFWIPTFIRRLSGLPPSSAALLVALLGLLGIVGMLLNGWHSDRTGERRWHASIPLLCAGVAYLLIPSGSNFSISMALLVFGGGIFYSYYPVFWSIPTMVLSETAAAASFGLINSIGLIGGFIGPYAVGWLNDRTGGLTAAFLLIAVCYLSAGMVLALIRIPSPLSSSAANLSAKHNLAPS